MAEESVGTKRGPGRWIAVTVAVVVAVALLRFLGSGDKGPEGGWVHGVVLGADGAPVPGASVEATFDVEGTNVQKFLRSGPTGPDGVFTFPKAPEKWKGLHIVYSKWPLGAEMDLGDTPGPHDLRLTLPKAFTIGGCVVTAEMGQPLPGMDVRFGEKWTRTDSRGRFAMRDLSVKLLEKPLPPLVISGERRKELTRELAGGGERLDDLTLRLERGP
jgi:hypothetical protein